MDEAITSELIEKHHSTSNFDCGNDYLNIFLRDGALQYEQESVGTTFLFFADKTLVDYVTFCADSLRLNNRERRAAHKDYLDISEFPAFKIARLAVDKRFQKKGYGMYILSWAVGHIHKTVKSSARYATVDAEPASVPFYERYNFTRNLHERHSAAERTTVSMRFDLETI